MIIRRAIKYSLNKANKNKLDCLDSLFADYQAQLQYYIDLIWDKQLGLSKNLSSKDLPHLRFMHSRWKQICYKQASEIIRSNSKRKKTSKPLIKNVAINLDERVFDIRQGKLFDHFIKIILPYFNQKGTRALSVRLPFNSHSFAQKYGDWKQLNTVKIKKQGKNYILYITLEKDVPKKLGGREVGADAGYNKLYSLSDGVVIGDDMKILYDKISRKRQGSKAFKRALIERNEKINTLLKSIDLSNVKIMYVENLKNLNKNVRKNNKRRKKQMNKQQRWVYSYSLNKLEYICNESGVELVKVSPEYTSQRCSECGAIHSESREGELFECIVCGIELDADDNASRNILYRGKYGVSTTGKLFVN